MFNFRKFVFPAFAQQTILGRYSRQLHITSITMSSSLNYPPLSAKFKGTFAYKTVKDRMPIILTQAIDYLCRDKISIQTLYGENSLEEVKAVIGKLSQLRSEMQTNKPLALLITADADGDLWNKCYAELEQPIKWFDSPWLFVECFMYRQIWEVFQQTSLLKYLDPFHQKKAEAYYSSIHTIRTIAAHFMSCIQSSDGPKDIERNFSTLMEVALWGNRNDLSLSAGETESKVHDIMEDLKQLKTHILVDDIHQVWSYISNRKSKDDIGEVAWIMDNIGLEIIGDLCLADFLIHNGFFHRIRFHIKRMPWFVSDVTERDFHWTLEQLKSDQDPILNQLAERWSKYLEDGQWTIIADGFWTLPLPYHAMKSKDPELYGRLSSANLLIFKGDLNYRKLGGDLQWPSEIAFDEMLQGFRPAPLVILRTLKAEIVSGLDSGRATKLSETVENWLVSGEYAVVQFADSV